MTFLTRVPLARVATVGGEDIARGSALFPLVGAGVGAAGGGAALLAHQWLPPLLSAALGCAVTLVLSGALHVDALADTADALGAPTRERALEIMRDSRIGSFGAAAIVLDLLLQIGAVSVLVERGGVLGAFVAAGALSRAVGPALASWLPYPRPDPGVLAGRVSRAAAALTVGLALALAVATVRGDAGWLGMAAAAAALLLGVAYSRWLGGATGDCLGAATEATQTVVLLVAAGLA